MAAPSARFRKRGEKRTASPPDPQQQAATKAAADAIVRFNSKLAPMAETLAHVALATYILKRAEQAFSDPLIMKALSSERPWDMVRLIDKTTEEEAVIRAALPIVGELVGEIDPNGDKPFFQYSKDDVIRLFEAVIWVWEESRGRVQAPDLTLGPNPHPRDCRCPVCDPATHVTPPPPPPPPQPIITRQGTLIDDDEIPF